MLRRQREVKDRASFAALRYPDSTAVALDNGSADGEAHPHSGGFGREHRLENAVEIGVINSRSRVFNRYMNDVWPGCFRRYAQHAALNRMHRLDGIGDEIQDDLLQLDIVSVHGRHLLIEFRIKVYFMFPQVDPDQPQDRPDQLVD